MKKIMFLFILTFVLFGISKQTFASDYTYGCGYCNGDYMNYYSSGINSPYVWCSISHTINNNTLINCNCSTYGLSASDDKFYTIKMIRDDGLYFAYIRLSTDNTFEIYNIDGSITMKPLSDFTNSNYGGISNNLYYGYWVYLASWNPYYIDYEESCNYQIVATSYTDGNNKMQKLVKFLTGELAELPNDVTEVTPLPIRDLEPPLNIKVDGINNNMFNNKQKSLKIRWEQSNIDLSGYETHFYFKESGRTRKTIFNEWQDVSTPWLFDQKFTTAKYCNNNLKFYEYKWWTEQSKLGNYANALLYGDETGGLMCEHSVVDFMIRNEKIDSDGVQHYSNWVYVNCFNDGTYQIYEMSDDYTLDKDSDETGNIKTDSDIYDSDTIYDEKDFDSTGVGDATNFIDSMKDLISSLREFPNLFAKIFSFFPAWILALIGMLFVAVLLARLFL